MVVATVRRGLLHHFSTTHSPYLPFTSSTPRCFINSSIPYDLSIVSWIGILVATGFSSIETFSGVNVGVRLAIIGWKMDRVGFHIKSRGASVNKRGTDGLTWRDAISKFYSLLSIPNECTGCTSAGGVTIKCEMKSYVSAYLATFLTKESLEIYKSSMLQNVYLPIEVKARRKNSPLQMGGLEYNLPMCTCRRSWEGKTSHRH